MKLFNRSRRRILSCVVVVALVVGLMPFYYEKVVQASPIIPSPAYTDVSFGVDLAEIYAPGNFIYLGQHKHALRLTSSDAGELIPVYGTVTKREPMKTPVLWKVMGDTEGTTNSITLMSQYVIDSQAYGSGSNPVWGGSSLETWLNGSFLTELFNLPNSKENSLIKSNLTVDTKGMVVVSNNLTFTGDDSNGPATVYLPWANGNNTGAFNNRNKAWWSVTNPADANAITGVSDYEPNYLVGNLSSTPEGVQLSKQAHLKPYAADATNTAQPVWYFTRTPERGGQVIVIDPEGINNTKPAGNIVGIRPLMAVEDLDKKIVMITEIALSGGRTDQMDPQATTDYTIYQDGDQVTGSTDKIYKLTILNTGLDSMLSSGQQIYHYDETLAVNDTVYVNQGKEIKLSNNTTATSGHSLAYKIVSDAGLLVHNGTATDLMDLNMKTKDITDSGNLAQGDYHAYVWAQQNNEMSSFEASTPLHFKLTIGNYGVPSIPTSSANRAPGGNTAINFDISGNGPQTGSYYYLVNPATVPTVDEIIATGNKTPYTIGAGQTTAPISLMENIPTGNMIYVLAKNQAGEISGVQPITITDQAANNPPVAKPSITQQVVAGNNISFDADDIAVDSDGDAISITNVNMGSFDPSLVNVTLTGNIVTVDGLAAGNTSVIVTVTDSQGATVNITVPINVDPAPPTQDPSVTPASVTMKKGETRAASLQLGLGASGVSGAAVTSNDTSVATVSPASISANGNVTITGVAKGTTQVLIAWANGTTDTISVTVTEDAITPPTPGTTQYTITYSGGTGGTVSSNSVASGGKIDENSVVQFTATPNANYRFTGWTVNGSASGTTNPYSLTISQDTTVVANFTYTGGGGNTGSGSSGGKGGGGGGGGRVDGQTPGKTTSKGNSGQGNDSLYLPTPFVVNPPRANEALKTQTKTGKTYSRIAYRGQIKVLATASTIFNTVPVRYDVIIDNAVQVRVTVLAPHLMKEDMYLSGYVKGNAVDLIQNAFKKWFKSEVFVIYFDQKGVWGQTVEIAAHVNFGDTPTNNLYFYSYNRENNTYAHINNMTYSIDSNGYLRFNTVHAGDIIVSNGPLVKK